MRFIRRCSAALIMLVGLNAINALAETIHVQTVSELHGAIAVANSSEGNITISIADGVYALNDTLYVNATDITIKSASGIRENVVLEGDAMSESAKIKTLIRVAAPNFSLHGVTLRRSGWHLIQIAGESNADSPSISDCILQDAYQQLVKVSANQDNLGTTSDNGLIEDCIFEYTAGIGPQYYIGGLDAHGAKNWIIRGNAFRNIVSPSSAIAEYAVHFWNQSENNVVERNLIVNCDRGIGFGLGDRGNIGGIIRNNMIYHIEDLGQFADVGIALQSSRGTQIYNNTIVLEHSYPSAIEYRFSGTSETIIANNLSNKGIAALDGATGVTISNVLTAQPEWFVDPARGDLHLADALAPITDRGTPITGLADDYDGDVRPFGPGIDIGADEYMH